MRGHRATSLPGDAPQPVHCALCGEPFASSAQVRRLGIAPVAVFVCADIDGCTRRYFAVQAAHGRTR